MTNTPRQWHPDRYIETWRLRRSRRWIRECERERDKRMGRVMYIGTPLTKDSLWFSQTFSGPATQSLWIESTCDAGWMLSMTCRTDPIIRACERELRARQSNA